MACEPLHFVREEVSVKLEGGRVEAQLYHHLLAHRVQGSTAFLTLQQMEWAPGSSSGRLQSLVEHADQAKLSWQNLNMSKGSSPLARSVVYQTLSIMQMIMQ